MDSVSLSEAARLLGTNLPRLQRAIERLGLKIEPRRGRCRLTEVQIALLQNELGVVKRADGLTRVETQVLAALERFPRGAMSARSIARRARVSPTATSHSIQSLERLGLVRRERRTIAVGRAREVTIIRPNVTAPDWHDIAPRLATVVLPAGSSTRRPRHVPARLRHLFWNADPARLDVDAHGGYIAERLLSILDLDGIAWGSSALAARDWEHAARTRGMTPRQRSLARNLARAAPR